jgi:hypothetical protein
MRSNKTGGNLSFFERACKDEKGLSSLRDERHAGEFFRSAVVNPQSMIYELSRPSGIAIL